MIFRKGSKSGPSVDGPDELELVNVADQSSTPLGSPTSAVDEQVHQLARRFTSPSQSHGNTETLFPVVADGPLDPWSKHFDARRWAKAFYHLRSDVDHDHAHRTSSIAFQNLSVHGYGTPTDYQKSVGNIWVHLISSVGRLLGNQKQRINILRDLEGLVRPGEMLAVLGPPGSGCSTLLKTIAGETHGLYLDQYASINYQGITPDQMRSFFRGEAIYTAEMDAHYPHMTVGDTLYFAARMRCPRTIPDDTSRRDYAEHLRDVTMAMFGISHTMDTRVGDNFIRGVSGGERKRVTIAEATLGYAPLQCWDNSTRGLDSASALNFCRTLRTQADTYDTTACVSLYQASQGAYDVFDKVLVLYEGRQIYFGKTTEAQQYFEELGFVCPDQQTTADFLTSMTSHTERIIRPGLEHAAPQTPDEFAEAWKRSLARSSLVHEIDSYLDQHPFHSEHYDKFLASRRQDQSTSQRPLSPFTISYWGQIKLNMWRNLILLKNDPSNMILMFIISLFQSITIGTLFLKLSPDSSSISQRGTLLFFVVLMNAFSSILEILTLYAKRPIVEKHARYALYHPSAEALATIIVDLPYKILNCLITNTALYFMASLRPGAGAFFFFQLVIFIVIMTMSMLFRLMGSLTKTIDAALAPASVILLVIMLYTGFAIKVQNMQSWLSWLRWINPAHYGFESLMVNEFVGRTFECVSFVPSGPSYEDSGDRVCSVVGARSGDAFVDGAEYLSVSYGYKNEHRWRNVGIVIAFFLAFLVSHLVATEYIASAKSKGEVLVFSRKALKQRHENMDKDVETKVTIPRVAIKQSNQSHAVNPASKIETQTSIFHWADVCYDVKVKGKSRRILDHVDGWVKPGTLTALMGVSGAGKTTLLDALACRITMGVVSGSMLVDGNPRDQSFQRKTGYVTQQDLHLHTATVREALTFSALLRQPNKYSRSEKVAYVDTVIELLEMQEYSEGIIGILGEGLNVEQRKRVTIGVELAARPQLLLFLDEPTSGLDSQTSWSVCNLLEKLTKSGQAILCTVHQPSAILFQRFDRLLLLAKGGKTVYFGDIGKGSQVLVDYFVRNGGPQLTPNANPAEYMLEVIGAADGAHTDVDWTAVWRSSPEYKKVQLELERLAENSIPVVSEKAGDRSAYSEFAAPTGTQYKEVIRRVFQQYYRMPGYIYSKAFLSVGAALFIGLSFLNASNTQSGLQNQLFGVFIFLTIFSQLVDQIMPIFVDQRSLYEARERPAKSYSWTAFLAANMLVETFYNSVMSIFSFLLWYFPMGLYRNARESSAEHARGATSFVFIWIFFVFTTSFTFLVIAGMDSYEMAGGIVGLLTILMFTFCGVLAGPDVMPRFWIFMYRVNPFTYFVEGFMGTALAEAEARCDSNEYLSFSVPDDLDCGLYMEDFINTMGGFLRDSDATGSCDYCPIKTTDQFLSYVNIDFSNRWRNWGIMWAFIIFNVAAAFFFFWLARVPKNRRKNNS